MFGLDVFRPKVYRSSRMTYRAIPHFFIKAAVIFGFDALEMGAAVFLTFSVEEGASEVREVELRF